MAGMEGKDTADSRITDGDKVRHIWGRPPRGDMLSTDGTAFIRNGKQQWLVKWDNEREVDVVHESFLQKVP